MDAAQQAFEKKDSITLKRNAKGEYAWDIKLYFDLSEEDPEEVINAVYVYDDKLRDQFLRQVVM
jgi:hypothetical protein